MKLTKRELVIVYLYRLRFHKFDDYEVDYELTVNGVIYGINISRWYLSTIFTELENEGHVVSHYCHVEGYEFKVKGYGLTEKGMDVAQALENRETKDSSIEALKAKAKGFRNLGLGDKLLTHYDDALIWYSQGLNLIEGKMPDIELSILIDMGNVYNDKREFEKAIQHYKRALNLVKVKDVKKNEVCRLYNNIGIAYQRMEEYGEAIKHFNLSLENEGTSIDTGHSYVELAYVYAITNEIEKATDYNERGLKIFKKLNDMNMIIGVYKNKGIVFQQKEKYDKSLEWLKKAFDLSVKHNYSFNLDELKALIKETEKSIQKGTKGRKQA